MIDPHKEYTLLEAAQAVLTHVEDETARRMGTQCTLCFSYRKALRDAIERHEKHFRALVDSRDFWMKAAQDESEKVVELNDMLVAKKKSNDDYHKALEDENARLKEDIASHQRVHKIEYGKREALDNELATARREIADLERRLEWAR